MKPVIVSFPRSGRTWLKIMIGLVACHNKGISSDNCEEERRKIVDATHDKTDKSLKVDYRDLKTDKKEYADKVVLLLLREPKDVVVSAWLHATKNKRIFKGSLQEYIRDSKFGIKKIVTFYNIWFQNRFVPKEFKVLWYEDLMWHTEERLKEVCALFGIPHTSQDIAFAVETTVLDNLRNLENNKKKYNDPERQYFRKGKINGYWDYMTEEDIKFCDEAIKELVWLRP